MKNTRFGLAALALTLLGLASSYPSLGNGYAQDDRPIIEVNEEVHTLANPAGFFTRSYWPKPYQPALYRPLASMGFAAQWVLGDGNPRVYRMVSIGLLIAVGLAFYWLAQQIIPASAAWTAAAFFVVHPVHVESVAAAVNQSELVVGLLAVLLVGTYVSARNHAERANRHLSPMMFGLFLIALLFKESGAVLVGLVIVAELLLVTDPAPWHTRLARLRPTLLVMVLGATAFIAIRSFALAGDLLGTFVAEGLEGATVGGRAITMLGVVPHWFRLLLWPAHLRGDYSPREIDPALGFGTPQVVGGLLLILTIGLVVRTWRRLPVVAFGIVWTAIALFPVSNVLIPTGVVLAERTLFLPSVGAMIAVGGGVGALLPYLASRRALATAGAIAVGAILTMGASRSASRQRIWRSNESFWQQTSIDAPRSYRARHAYAQILFARGDRAAAELEFKAAIALYPKAWAIFFGYANTLRMKAMCNDAIVFYQRVLLIEPTASAARAGMIACLVYESRYVEAGQAAREGQRLAPTPGQRKLYGRFLAIADSAERVGAAARSVTLTVEPQDTLP